MDILYEASTGLGTQGYDATRRAGDPHPARGDNPDPIARRQARCVRVWGCGAEHSALPKISNRQRHRMSAVRGHGSPGGTASAHTQN